MDRSARARGRLAAVWLLSLLASTALGLAAAGCGAGNPHAVGTYERGLFWLEKGRYQDAVDAFGIFVRQNPTDSLAARAQFDKALASMKMKDYPLAAVEFQILTKDHPTSPLVEEALFRQGECYYFQVGRIERDVTPAYEARLHWLEFSNRYPDSEFMPQVRAYMAEIADMMVEKRLQRVEVYRQLGKWQAVALSLDRTLQEEPSSSLLDEVLWQRARVAERLEEADVAIAMYRRLVREHPDSPHRDRARDALARLAPDDGSPP